MAESVESRARWEWLRFVAPIAVVVLLPGVGFITNQVISNSSSIAVLNKTSITITEAADLIKEHARDGVHDGAATKTELKAAIAEAVMNLEKQQKIRDEAQRREAKIRHDNIDRQLGEIKEALRK
jgi:hypothetical protein